MDRRGFIAGTLTLLASPRAVDAQASGKVYRVGLLSPAGPPPAATYDSRSDLVEVLREFGYVEGRNLTVTSFAASMISTYAARSLDRVA
jgi:hypothetical protein